jgi:hypothetical protein
MLNVAKKPNMLIVFIPSVIMLSVAKILVVKFTGGIFK